MPFKPLVWWAVRTSGGDEAAFRELLGEATEEQLVLLHARMRGAQGLLMSEPGLIGRAEPGQAAALAEWVVGRGEQAWKAACAEPETLPSRPPEGAPMLIQAAAQVYAERFGGAIPQAEPDPAGDDLEPTDAWLEQAWKVAGVVGVGVPLEEATAGFTRSELVRLSGAYEVLYRQARGALAASGLGLDEDDAYWLAAWAVDQGRDAWEGFAASPASLPEADAVAAYRPIGLRLDAIYQGRYRAPMP